MFTIQTLFQLPVQFVFMYTCQLFLSKRNQNSFQCNERFQESVYQIIYAPIQPSNLSRLHMTEKGGKTIFRTTRCQSSFLRIIRIDVINIHDKYYNLVYLKQSSFELRRRTTTIDVFNRFHFFNGISHTFCMRHVSTIIGKKKQKIRKIWQTCTFSHWVNSHLWFLDKIIFPRNLTRELMLRLRNDFHWYASE